MTIIFMNLENNMIFSCNIRFLKVVLAGFNRASARFVLEITLLVLQSNQHKFSDEIY